MAASSSQLVPCYGSAQYDDLQKRSYDVGLRVTDSSAAHCRYRLLWPTSGAYVAGLIYKLDSSISIRDLFNKATDEGNTAKPRFYMRKKVSMSKAKDKVLVLPRKIIIQPRSKNMVPSQNFRKGRSKMSGEMY